MTKDKWTRRGFLQQASLLGAAGLAWSLRPARLLGSPDVKPGSADWPRFGYDLHNTRFNAKETTIGPSNVEKLKVKWTFETLDNWIVYETPAVVGDSVFFGAGRYIYSVDASTGKLKWKFDWGADGDWESAGARVSPAMRGIRSSPQYQDGRIYFGSPSCAAFCLDASTGKQIWKTPLVSAAELDKGGGQIYYSPVVYGGKMFSAYSGGNASIFCVDAETGALRWKFRVAQDVPAEWEAGGGSPWTSGAIDEERGILYNGTGNFHVTMPNLGLYANSLVAHDMNTGELLWYNQVHPQDTMDLDFNAHPMIFDAMAPGRVRGSVRQCVAAGNKAGMYCWDRYSGQMFWHVMLGMSCAGCGPENNATAFAYNRVYLEWISEAGPAPSSCTAALHSYNGDVQWLVPNPGRSSSPIAVANQVLYEGFLDGRMRALDARDGKTLWEYKLPSMFKGGVAIANGAMYTSNGGTLQWKPDQSSTKYAVYCFTLDGK